MKDSSVFFAETLPKIMGDKKGRFHCYLSTYRAVLHIDAGTYELEDGLTITVHTGELRSSPLVRFASQIFISTGDPAAGEAMHDQMVLEATSTVDVMRKHEDEFKTPPDLVFIYLGLSAFDHTVRTVMQMKRQWPGTHFVGVTCDCNLAHKTTILSQEVYFRRMLDYLVTPSCGARALMKQAFIEVSEAWKKVS